MLTSIGFVFIIVGIEFKLFSAFFHRWILVHANKCSSEIFLPPFLSIYTKLGLLKTPWTCRKEILYPLEPTHNICLFK
ncbi:hypothetical protein NC652_007567 [Populus alba x Populus x berolinensis]|uniref:Uncharacterized protein n=1 Tax=Populus alba x Populus x berolinensis TaxID=444605 RepID=A0AAD6RHM9_9ROSI|nr:hypothetical protein NC652_007567 [Populus alba x Populus x berolinensis]KAJ7008899.1 hypothetical protein NC653_007532 [Populus alba x Populus x berolinensis]